MAFLHLEFRQFLKNPRISVISAKFVGLGPI